MTYWLMRYDKEPTQLYPNDLVLCGKCETVIARHPFKVGDLLCCACFTKNGSIERRSR